MTGETPRHIETFVLNEVIWSIFTRLSFFFTGDFSIPYRISARVMVDKNKSAGVYFLILLITILSPRIQ
jgi:hypothetical protein